MPDSVDTDALRTAGRMLAPGFPGVDEAMTAAADEVDRLRGELVKAIRDTRAATKEAEYERGRADGYEREMNGLVALIENAPHADQCSSNMALTSAAAVCDCWKVDAL